MSYPFLCNASWVDVRESANPLVLSTAQWLHRVNARHPWNHNEHFHRWILRNLPARRQAAVDVGCGTGVLAEKLVPRFARVTGIDADEDMAAAASARLADKPNVSIKRCRFGTFAETADEGMADLITMVAVLHHLDLGDTLPQVSRLLAPGGRLLVVGLAKVDTPTDVMIDLVSAAANPIVGLIKHPHAALPADVAAVSEPVMPVRDPSTTLAEIAAAVSAGLPGATIRHRLFFRYTLRWDKPRLPCSPQGRVARPMRRSRLPSGRTWSSRRRRTAARQADTVRCGALPCERLFGVDLPEGTENPDQRRGAVPRNQSNARPRVPSPASTSGVRTLADAGRALSESLGARRCLAVWETWPHRARRPPFTGQRKRP
jgi:SAM-dependent methyltransferase